MSNSLIARDSHAGLFVCHSSSTSIMYLHITHVQMWCQLHLGVSVPSRRVRKHSVAVTVVARPSTLVCRGFDISTSRITSGKLAQLFFTLTSSLLFRVDSFIRYAATVAAIPADCIRDSYVSATQVPSHTRNLISAAVFSGVLFCDMLIETHVPGLSIHN
jgi:predicted secreted protein